MRKANTMTAEEQNDRKDKERFKKEFSKHYIFQDTQSLYAMTDMQMTACTTGIRYNTEIKNRNYSISEISDGAFLEKQKLEHFRELRRKDSQVCLIYFNYMTDGWVAFDMSGRIKYNEGLDNQFKMTLPSTTNIEGYMKEKDMVSICFTNNFYVQDKIRYYEK
jgi:hypothetical protein